MIKHNQILITNLIIPVIVEHGCLNPEDRIDDHPSRLDFLNCSIDTVYTGELDHSKFLDSIVWQDMKTITSPLETILVDVAQATSQAIATHCNKRQDSTPPRIHVSANRNGLSSGFPMLEVWQGTNRQTKTQENHNMSTKFSDHPIILKGESGILYQALLSFQVKYKTHGYINSDNLDGLFNYSQVVNKINQHNWTSQTTSPMEAVNMILNWAEQSAEQQSIQATQISVSIKDETHPRCVYSLGVVVDY